MRVAGTVVQRIFNEGRRSLDIDLPAAGREMNRNCSKPEKEEREVEGRDPTTSNMHGSHEADYQEPLSKSFPAINEECLTKLMQMRREN